jgi:heptosyltransferase I
VSSGSSPPKRVLIVRLSSLGDVIQTLPLPAAIRRSFPQTKIGWAIDAELVPAIAGHRDVDYIHPCPRAVWRKAARNPLCWPRIGMALRNFAGEIRDAGYDVAIDAQGLLMSALIPFAARITRRVGFAHRRELSHFFYTERYVSKEEYFDPQRPHFEHMLALARAIGCDSSDHGLALPEVAAHVRDAIAARLDKAFESGGPLIAVAPGTQWPSKQWPMQHWAQLLEMILTRTAANVVLIGSREEAELAAQLIQGQNQRGQARILNLAGRTTLPELYALLGRTPIVIAADTAPLHAAGAARCAHLIGLYGPTPGGRTGPHGSPDVRLLCAAPKLDCQPCRRPRCRYGTNQCMRNIAPADVFGDLVQALDMARGE